MGKNTLKNLYYILDAMGSGVGLAEGAGSGEASYGQKGFDFLGAGSRKASELNAKLAIERSAATRAFERQKALEELAATERATAATTAFGRNKELEKHAAATKVVAAHEERKLIEAMDMIRKQQELEQAGYALQASPEALRSPVPSSLSAFGPAEYNTVLAGRDPAVLSKLSSIRDIAPFLATGAANEGNINRSLEATSARPLIPDFTTSGQRAGISTNRLNSRLAEAGVPFADANAASESFLRRGQAIGANIFPRYPQGADVYDQTGKRTVRYGLSREATEGYVTDPVTGLPSKVREIKTFPGGDREVIGLDELETTPKGPEEYRLPSGPRATDFKVPPYSGPNPLAPSISLEPSRLSLETGSGRTLPETEQDLLSVYRQELADSKKLGYAPSFQRTRLGAREALESFISKLPSDVDLPDAASLRNRGFSETKFKPSSHFATSLFNDSEGTKRGITLGLRPSNIGASFRELTSGQEGPLTLPTSVLATGLGHGNNEFTNNLNSFSNIFSSAFGSGGLKNAAPQIKTNLPISVLPSSKSSGSPKISPNTFRDDPFNRLRQLQRKPSLTSPLTEDVLGPDALQELLDIIRRSQGLR